MEQMEFDFSFTDRTICETEGVFDAVEELMNEDFVHDWFIHTFLTIDSTFGIASFSLGLWFDKRIVIKEYFPSIGNVFYNPDLQALHSWSMQNGWKVPEPSTHIVRENVEFWRHYWATGLIDSDLLVDMFGDRDEFDEDEDVSES